MTYEDIVFKVREGFENADAREIHEHIAIQVNIVGEGSGAFYIEVAERSAVVEPYDYYDRDGLFTTDADTIIAIAAGELSLEDAVQAGKLSVEGNPEKLKLFAKVKVKNMAKGKTAGTTKKVAKKSTVKTPSKKVTKK